MSNKPSETHKYPTEKIYPFIAIPEDLRPEERFVEITDKIAPGILPNYYSISNYGRVMHNFTGQLMSLTWDGPGYTIAVLRTYKGSKTFRVHRLVMLAFKYFEGCELYFVDHINGDKSQNWVEVPILNPATGQYVLTDNLRWATNSENLQYRYNDSEQKKFAKLKEYADKHIDSSLVEYICEQLQNGIPVSTISKELNINYNIVSCIKYGYTWTDISKKYVFPESTKKIRRSISDEQAHQICRLLQRKKALSDIIRITGVNKSIIDSIRRKECYTDISKDYDF